MCLLRKTLPQKTQQTNILQPKMQPGSQQRKRQNKTHTILPPTQKPNKHNQNRHPDNRPQTTQKHQKRSRNHTKRNRKNRTTPPYFLNRETII